MVIIQISLNILTNRLSSSLFKSDMSQDSKIVYPKRQYSYQMLTLIWVFSARKCHKACCSTKGNDKCIGIGTSLNKGHDKCIDIGTCR